jgi:hypothetical protein
MLPTKVEKFCTVIAELIPPAGPCKLSACRLTGCTEDASDLTVGLGSCVGARGPDVREGPSLRADWAATSGGVAIPIGDSIMPALVGADLMRSVLTTGTSVARSGAA